MHARMLQVKTKPGQVKDFVKGMLDRGLPIIRQQPGFVDAIALTADTEADQFVGLSIWKTKQDAENYLNGPGRQLLESFRSFFQQEPSVRTFNLEASTVHNIGVGRAASN